LLEPTRANSLRQSNQFDTTWSLSSSISLTSGQSGVGGSTDAWLLKKTDAASRYINQTITLSSSTYSYSVFAKKESGNWLYVRLADSGGSLASTSYFDLENGVVGSTSADSLSIQSYNNGWYRCEVKFTHSIGNVRMYPAVGNGSPSGGSGGEGIYIYGAQLEEGSYATSYIPTSGSAVTRVVDSCLQVGFQDKNIFGTTQGSAVFELKWDIGSYVFDFSDALGIRLRIFDGGSNWKIRDYGGASWVNTNFSKTNNVKTKIGFKWNGTQFTSFQDGVKSSSTDSFASSMAIESITTNKLNNTSDMQFYNTALTDQELIALTKI
jgi:hypothetical protein